MPPANRPTALDMWDTGEDEKEEEEEKGGGKEDADMDMDDDVDMDVDVDVDIYTPAGGNTSTDMTSYRDATAGANPKSKSKSKARTNGNTTAYSNVNSKTNANANTSSRTNSYTNANSYTHANANANANARPGSAMASQAAMPVQSRSPSVAGSGSGYGSGYASGSAAAIGRPDSSLGKRKSALGLGDGGAGAEGASGDAGTASKRRQLAKPVYFRAPAGVKMVQEGAKLAVPGEDPDALADDDEKPVRELYDFAVFDPAEAQQRVLVSLAGLERSDGVDRQFEGAGYVVAVRAEDQNDEDEGQEDDDEDEDDDDDGDAKRKDGGAGDGRKKALYVRLGAIFGFSVDYTRIDEPVYIETQYAWYVLKTSSRAYEDIWETFYAPLRLAQIVIASALQMPKETTFHGFVAAHSSKTLFGQSLTQGDFLAHAAEIQRAIQQEPDARRIMSAAFVKHIIARAPAGAAFHANANTAARKAFPHRRVVVGSLDSLFTQRENQTQTCVTPRIATLAAGYFKETLRVVGKPPPAVNAAAEAAAARSARAYLWNCVVEARRQKKVIAQEKMFVKQGSVHVPYFRAVKINDITYRIGDTILCPNPDKTLPQKPGHLPSDASLFDYFWFGRICYVYDGNDIHVQWFNHGSTTLLGELAHPQELFLDYTCDQILASTVVGKVNMAMFPGQLPQDYVGGPLEYFCKSRHSRETGAFTSLDLDVLKFCFNLPIPENCHQCLLANQREDASDFKHLYLPGRILAGLSYGGNAFHFQDFILYHTEKGPAQIGFITGFKFGKASAAEKGCVTIRKVGRVQQIGSVLPSTVLKDERHLYLTKETTDVLFKDLLQVIFVPSEKSLKSSDTALEDWLQASPDHFYLTWCFPKLVVTNWDRKSIVNYPDLHVCLLCCKSRIEKLKKTQEFHRKTKKLATLDLFGGVGAFSRSLADGCGQLEVTHAVEIIPSAAKTFKENSPHTVVYNQCANEVLQYAVRLENFKETPAPLQNYDSRTPIPNPPKQGDISVITAGFPCQGHSDLNRFKVADNQKNNLILTTLSFIDHYSPQFAFFENVPGFLRFSLREKQVDADIESGGLKFCVRALLDMNYQVHFGLLEAAQYGTPQRRKRFFLVAAKNGHILPALPVPTHSFEYRKKITFNHCPPIQPVFSSPGTALHRFISVEDAIGDLLQFDWKHPKSKQERARIATRHQGFCALECKKGEAFCGYKGKVQYQSKPLTRYQMEAQKKPAADLQHYSKVLMEKTVERVLSIPLKAGADYTNIPANLGAWQLVDPSSALGRRGYKTGAYSRIDKDGVFQTTVTNVDPAAKQSQVLHPWCHRIVTVRELARSQGFPDNFVFKSLTNNVIDMHRQIGNAVPLPVGRALGRELGEALFEKWKSDQANAIVVD